MTELYALNLRHLFMIGALERTGSITAASGLVHLSQPALTQGLANIETAIGCQLFDRQHAGISANKAGRLFSARIERAAAQLNEGRRSFRRMPSGAIESHLSMAQLRALVAISTHGGFALAAKATGLSQPSIHRAARELEQIVGNALFLRVGRTVQLTPAAIRFVHHIRLALAELRAGLAEIEALREAGSGRVVVGAMPLARAYLLPRVVARFCQDYQRATVKIVDGPYGELLSGLRTGEIDLLLGALREPLPSPDIRQQALFEDRLIIVGRWNHPLADVAEPSIRQLGEYPWVISQIETPLRARWEALFTFGKQKIPPVQVECSSVMAIRGLLLQGDWLSLLSPDQIQIERQAGLIREIGRALPSSPRQIGLTTRRDWHPTAVQQAFIARLREMTLSIIE
jgi:LysR family transcriptional regulator of gallate degradation